MITNQTEENLEQTSLTGFKGLLAITGYKKLLKSTTSKLSLLVAVVGTGASLVLGISEFEVIAEVKNVLIAFLPCILGFTIAGFTLLVGFLQSDLLDSITERTSDSQYSLYQQLVSNFALGVLVQSLALMIAYIYHFIIFYESKTTIVIPIMIAKVINVISLAVILYAFTISVLLVAQVIINVFNFSQLHHFVLVKKKIDEEKGTKNKKQS